MAAKTSTITKLDMSWRIFNHVRKRKIFLIRSTLKLRNVRCTFDVIVTRTSYMARKRYDAFWNINVLWDVTSCLPVDSWVHRSPGKWHPSPSDMTPLSRRMKVSDIPIRKPQKSQGSYRVLQETYSFFRVVNQSKNICLTRMMKELWLF